MFTIGRAADPHVHEAACRIANRIVSMIQSLLRRAEERDAALREAYRIASQDIETPRKAGA